MLFLHPRRLDVTDRLRGSVDPFDDGVFKTLGRLGTDLDDLGNGRGTTPFCSGTYPRCADDALTDRQSEGMSLTSLLYGNHPVLRHWRNKAWPHHLSDR